MPQGADIQLAHTLLADFSAWDAWKAHNPGAHEPEIVRLLPLLYQRLRDHDRRRDEWFARAEAAYRFTWAKNERLFQSVSRILGQCREEGIDVMLLKGSAIADAYYGDRGLRPMLDFDFLVRQRDLASAVAVFDRAGWSPARRGHARLLSVRHDLPIRHNGFECDLHWTLHPSWNGASEDQLWRESIAASCNDVEVRMPSTAYLLAHLLLHGKGAAPSLVDAVVVARRDGLDARAILDRTPERWRPFVRAQIVRIETLLRNALPEENAVTPPPIRFARLQELQWLVRRGAMSGAIDFGTLVRGDWNVGGALQMTREAIRRLTMPNRHGIDGCAIASVLFPTASVVPQHITVAAPAPYGAGGLGQFLAAIVEAATPTGHLRYFATHAKNGDPRGVSIAPAARSWPAFRADETARFARFDRAVAAKLLRGDVFVGFGGASLASFRRARELRYRELVLEPGTSHVARVLRQQKKACARHPMDRGWLTAEGMRRREAEYAIADAIYVTSSYARDTFLEAGVPEQKLRFREQPIAARFLPAPAPRRSEKFIALYVGRLELMKGTALLVDAFRNFHEADAELWLFGGFATRAMERYVRTAQAADPRIRVGSGDPLASYHAADVLVHPSYEDALGLAPMEALACGVPAIVTDHTGMADRIREGVNGYVVGAGDSEAIVARMKCVRNAPLKSNTSLL